MLLLASFHDLLLLLAFLLGTLSPVLVGLPGLLIFVAFVYSRKEILIEECRFSSRHAVVFAHLVQILLPEHLPQLVVRSLEQSFSALRVCFAVHGYLILDQLTEAIGDDPLSFGHL